MYASSTAAHSLGTGEIPVCVVLETLSMRKAPPPPGLFALIGGIDRNKDWSCVSDSFSCK